MPYFPWRVWQGAGYGGFKRRRFLPLLAFLLVQSLISLFFIALAPWMDRTYSLPISQESLRSYLLFFLVYLSFFLCTVMYLSSRLLSAWKDRSPAHKYTGENLFFYGQVLSKLRSASKSMTLISLTLVLSTVLFALSPALSGWAIWRSGPSMTCRSTVITTMSSVRKTCLKTRMTLSPRF